MRVLITLSLELLVVPAAAGEKEWVKGVPYTTDFKAAIKQAHATGKILLIYNGWQPEKV